MAGLEALSVGSLEVRSISKVESWGWLAVLKSVMICWFAVLTERLWELHQSCSSSPHPSILTHLHCWWDPTTTMSSADSETPGELLNLAVGASAHALHLQLLYQLLRLKPASRILVRSKGNISVVCGDQLDALSRWPLVPPSTCCWKCTCLRVGAPQLAQAAINLLQSSCRDKLCRS